MKFESSYSRCKCRAALHTLFGCTHRSDTSESDQLALLPCAGRRVSHGTHAMQTRHQPTSTTALSAAMQDASSSSAPARVWQLGPAAVDTAGDEGASQLVPGAMPLSQDSSMGVESGRDSGHGRTARAPWPHHARAISEGQDCARRSGRSCMLSTHESGSDADNDDKESLDGYDSEGFGDGWCLVPCAAHNAPQCVAGRGAALCSTAQADSSACNATKDAAAVRPAVPVGEGARGQATSTGERVCSRAQPCAQRHSCPGVQTCDDTLTAGKHAAVTQLMHAPRRWSIASSNVRNSVSATCCICMAYSRLLGDCSVLAHLSNPCPDTVACGFWYIACAPHELLGELLILLQSTSSPALRLADPQKGAAGEDT